MTDATDRLSYSAVEDILRETVAAMLPQLAEVAMEKLSQRYPGVRLYVPVDANNLSRNARDSAIRAEFDGTNMREICRRYQIGRSTFYRVIAAKPPGR